MAQKYREHSIRTLREFEFKGKRVFCRLDLNVPLKNGEVTDDKRIQAALPTIQYLLDQGAVITLASHLGRPKGQVNPAYSLMPVADRLADLTGREIVFPDDCIGSGTRKVLKDRNPEAIVLLENLRFHAEEEKNDEAFAKELRGETDIYVSDAFGALHRAHASTWSLPRLYTERGIGFLVEKELAHLDPLLKNPQSPYALILGGAKISDKIKVIESFLKKIDHLFLGGAMVFTFMKAKGLNVGASLVELDRLNQATRIMEDAAAKGVRIHFPIDFQLGRSVEDPGTPEHLSALNIPEGKMGLDIGPATIEDYAKKLREMKTIFWNGPMGLFERPPFDAGTVGIAKCLAELDAVRVIGGGDSASAVKKAGLEDKMTHISTGGGASLEFLEGKALPGLESLAV